MTTQGGSVGVVIAGAGARGAYEAGLLSVLIPALVREGAAPALYVGTSAGAINATLFVAGAHLPIDLAVKQVTATWASMDWRQVFRPPLLSAPVTAIAYLAEVVGLPRPRLTSLLDTAPLRQTAESAIDLAQLHRNLDEGPGGTLAVVTTSARGRSVVFAQGDRTASLPESDLDRAIDYVSATLDTSHVLASSAIPILFPAQRIEQPPALAGWYTDGGDRLNAPLKPALSFGAERLVVVATHPATYAHEIPVGTDLRPEVDDLVVQVLEAVLVDRMVEDVRALARVNTLVDGKEDSRFRVVPYVFAGPPTRTALGQLAEDVYDEVFSGIAGRARALTSPFPVIRRLLASTDGPRTGDLLSFLFFHPRFAERALQLGRTHAEALLEPGGSLPWRTAPPGE